MVYFEALRRKRLMCLDVNIPPRTSACTSRAPTSTAAGLVFIGGASDRRFRAYETKTGQELWSVETEQMISGANPITYMGTNGKQYVAVAAGTTLLAYALP